MIARNEQTQEVSALLPLFPVNSAGFISKCFSALTITRKLQTTRSLEGGRKGGVAPLIIILRWARGYHICTQ